MPAFDTFGGGQPPASQPAAILPTAAPVFSQQPTIDKDSGVAGDTFTATSGVSDGTLARIWMLNSTAISSGLTAVPLSEGLLEYIEISTGLDGQKTLSQTRRARVRKAPLTATPTPGPTPTLRLNVAVLSDIDTPVVSGQERDDNIALAYMLQRQDVFAPRLLVACEPDGNSAAYPILTKAYGTDRPQIIAKYPGKEALFASEADLNTMVYQGPVADAGGAGYNTTDSANAARLIALAQQYGDPTGTPVTNPYGKLWIVLTGGYAVFVQACYQAIVKGQLPDFLKRVAVTGYVTYNASVGSPNAWAYLMAQYNKGTGPFADLWMINGMQNWYPFGGPTETGDLWNNTVRVSGAIGNYMERCRAASGYPAADVRAGDAGALLWLADAAARNDFDPTHAGNVAGQYQTNADTVPNWGTGTNWPTAQAAGPTMFCPIAAVTDTASARANGVSMSKFATMFQAAFSSTPLPELNISADVSQLEGNSGTTAYTYTVTRSLASLPQAGATTVPVTFTPGNTSPDDYVGGAYPSNLSIAFAANASSGTLTINVQGDVSLEPNETFSLQLVAPAGHALGLRNSATGTIVNDDGGDVYTDNMVESADTSITSHTANTGGTYTGLGSQPAAAIVAGGLGYVRGGSTTSPNSYAHSDVIPLGLKKQGKVMVPSAGAAGQRNPAILFMAVPGSTAGSYYRVLLADDGTWSLLRANDGVASTTLATGIAMPSGVTFAPDTWFTVEITETVNSTDAAGTVLSISVNGVNVPGLSVTDTASTRLKNAGRLGFANRRYGYVTALRAFS